MSDSKPKILIIDDSPDDIHLLMENLKQDYAIVAGTDGHKALAIAAKEPYPDAILLDVEMAGISGYETCRLLKQNEHLKDTDVIFVSAHETIDERLAGYEAGGSDYLIKPVQPEELITKVAMAVNKRKQRLQAAQDQSYASQTAITAITSVGETGVILDFMRNSFSVKSHTELARLLVNAASQYGLQGTAQIRGSRELITLSRSGPSSPLEEEFITRLSQGGRIIESNQRLVCNYDNVSLLIKDMPVDQEKRGRFRDNLAIILEGAESRFKALELELRMSRIVESANTTLKEISQVQEEHKYDYIRIMDDITDQMHLKFSSCGLPDDVEGELFNLIQQGIDESVKNYEEGLEINRLLGKITDRLGTISRG
jgi:DNA-binding response OmpR family regulator